MAAGMARYAQSVRALWYSDGIAPVVSEIIKMKFVFQNQFLKIQSIVTGDS